LVHARKYCPDFARVYNSRPIDLGLILEVLVTASLITVVKWSADSRNGAHTGPVGEQKPLYGKWWIRGGVWLPRGGHKVKRCAGEVLWIRRRNRRIVGR
jgi:hypothetical protein